VVVEQEMVLVWGWVSNMEGRKPRVSSLDAGLCFAVVGNGIHVKVQALTRLRRRCLRKPDPSHSTHETQEQAQLRFIGELVVAEISGFVISFSPNILLKVTVPALHKA
jgi:hypothetical protein